MRLAPLYLVLAVATLGFGQTVANSQSSSPQMPVGDFAKRNLAPESQQPPTRLTVPAGTKVLLALQSPITTKNATPGAPVYAATSFPITADGKMLIPAGTYVQGIIDQVQRPGRIKGRAQLQMHFTTLIYPNGYTVSLPAALSGSPGSESERVKGSEGRVEANGTKGKDAGTVATTTATGAGIGSLIGAVSGNAAKGLGIGAGAGAAAGLASVLFSRGPDIRFDVGTPLEMELQRPLVLEEQRVASSAGNFVPVQTVRPMERPNNNNNTPVGSVPIGLPYPRY
jgi:hypothetical protein